MADVNKRQSQVIGFLLPGFGHWTAGRWSFGKSLLYFLLALIVGAFTFGVGYLALGLLDAATV